MSEEIHGFQSPGEYKRLVAYLEGPVRIGQIRELQPDPAYGKGGIYGGRWFTDIGSGTVWRLVPPDFPFSIRMAGLRIVLRKPAANCSTGSKSYRFLRFLPLMPSPVVRPPHFMRNQIIPIIGSDMRPTLCVTKSSLLPDLISAPLYA